MQAFSREPECGLGTVRPWVIARSESAAPEFLEAFLPARQGAEVGREGGFAFGRCRWWVNLGGAEWHTAADCSELAKGCLDGRGGA